MRFVEEFADHRGLDCPSRDAKLRRAIKSNAAPFHGHRDNHGRNDGPDLRFQITHPSAVAHPTRHANLRVEAIGIPGVGQTTFPSQRVMHRQFPRPSAEQSPDPLAIDMLLGDFFASRFTEAAESRHPSAWLPVGYSSAVAMSHANDRVITALTYPSAGASPCPVDPNHTAIADLNDVTGSKRR